MSFAKMKPTQLCYSPIKPPNKLRQYYERPLFYLWSIMKRVQAIIRSANSFLWTLHHFVQKELEPLKIHFHNIWSKFRICWGLDTVTFFGNMQLQRKTFKYVKRFMTQTLSLKFNLCTVIKSFIKCFIKVIHCQLSASPEITFENCLILRKPVSPVVLRS